MPANDPQNTTWRDLCCEALKDSGFLGIGQSPAYEDINDAWIRAQWMLQQWQRKRWLVYHLVNYAFTSTGAQSYTIGPGGNIDTGINSTRPAKLETAFIRQGAGSTNAIDYWCDILQAREDYDKLSLKNLTAFSYCAFLDSAWPLGNLYFWPLPQAGLYEIHVSVMDQLPQKFGSITNTVNLPWEYYDAIVSNLAMVMRTRHQIGSFQGDALPTRAAAGLKTIRGPATQIGRLQMPNMGRNQQYNIFGDTSY